MSANGEGEWVSLVREEPVDAQRRIIDAHHHLWDEGEGLAGAPPYLHTHLLTDINGHNVVGTVYAEVGAGRLKDGPEDFRSVGETAFAAAQARLSASTRAPILGIVGQADLTIGALLGEVLDAHAVAGEGLFRGIRQLPAGTGGRENFNLFGDPGLPGGLRLMGARGFSFDVFAIVPQYPDVARLTREAPDTLFVLNHLGMPMFRPEEQQRDVVMAAWREGMRLLAACPNLVVKIGGIGMDSQFGMGWMKRPLPPTSDEAVAWWGDDIRWCIETFGPQRCIFESNFPVDRWAMGYTVLWNCFQKIAAQYGDGEQEELFSGTATRTYRLKGA